MAEGLDTGDMLLKTETEIGENETAGQLHDRLSQMGAKLITETLIALENGTVTPQNRTTVFLIMHRCLQKSFVKLIGVVQHKRFTIKYAD